MIFDRWNVNGPDGDGASKIATVDLIFPRETDRDISIIELTALYTRR